MTVRTSMGLLGYFGRVREALGVVIVMRSMTRVVTTVMNVVTYRMTMVAC